VGIASDRSRKAAGAPFRPCQIPIPKLRFPGTRAAGPRLNGRGGGRLDLAEFQPPGFSRCFSLFPIPDVAFSQQVMHNGSCPIVHVKNHQIRIKIDQKGDVFRQKGIKKARISSCPS